MVRAGFMLASTLKHKIFMKKFKMKALVSAVPLLLATQAIAADYAGSQVGFQLLVQARSAAQLAASILASETTDDVDGYPLPPAMLLGSGGPVGGGLIPVASGAPKTDGTAAKLGYCAWDTGTSTSAAGHIVGSMALAAPVLAVIAVGADGVFSTSCAQIAAGMRSQGDDIVITYSTAQLRSLYSLYIGAPVADLPTLATISPAILRDGEIRLFKATNSMIRWNAATTTWQAVGGSGGGGGTNTDLTAAASGSATAPSIAFAAQPSTGIYYTGGGIGFAVGGTPITSINSAGLVTTALTTTGATIIGGGLAVVGGGISVNAGGSAASPSISIGGNSNGLFLPNDFSVGISTGGIQSTMFYSAGLITNGITALGGANISGDTLMQGNLQMTMGKTLVLVSNAAGNGANNPMVQFNDFNNGGNAGLFVQGNNLVISSGGGVAATISRAGISTIGLIASGDVTIGGAATVSGDLSVRAGGTIIASSGWNASTAASPLIRFDDYNLGRTNTGFYMPNARSIGISAGGVSVANFSQTGLSTIAITTSGNAAIGGNLTVNGASSFNGDLTLGAGGTIILSSGSIGSTATSPLIRFDDYNFGRTNTGFYMPSARSIGISAGGVSVANFSQAGLSTSSITASGDVSIGGTTSVAGGLAVVGGGMSINASGSAAAPIIKLGWEATGLYLTGPYGIGISVGGGNVATFNGSGITTTALTTTSDSTIGGALSVAGGLTPSSDNSFMLGSAAQRWSAVYAANGVIQTSDARLKTNVISIDPQEALGMVMNLRPVRYNWANPHDGANRKVGFIAQELVNVLPETVYLPANGTNYLGVNYGEIVPALAGAIKAQQAIVSKITATPAGLKMSTEFEAAVLRAKQIYADKMTATEIDVERIKAKSIEAGKITSGEVSLQSGAGCQPIFQMALGAVYEVRSMSQSGGWAAMRIGLSASGPVVQNREASKDAAMDLNVIANSVCAMASAGQQARASWLRVL